MTSTHEFPRFGEVQKRRVRKDAVLLDAIETARAALVEAGATPGEHISAVMDDERLAVHRFAATERGYRGWEWYVSLARVPRSKEITVCESGLLPGADALQIPEWVPWSQRVSDEEKQKLAEKDAE